MKHLFTELRVPIEEDNPALKRIEGLCIKCGACKDVCDKQISIASHFSLDQTDDHAICIHCGQCINVCPTGALVERQEWMEVEQAVHDKDRVVIAMTSPSVRVALQEEFGYDAGEYHEEEMVGALRALGIDIVLDTTFAADLTIMEEASELIDRIQNNKPLPQFTSCCPAWVKFVETYYPEYIPNISSAKSPIGMFGPMIKTWYAKQKKLDPANIVTVALTPCTAKKFEIRREEMCDAQKETGLPLGQDVNHVITTRELASWMKAKNLDFNTITPSAYDRLMERGSGAGIIFGNSGGVMEAALRSAYFFLTGSLPPEDYLQFEPVRGLDGIKTATADLQGIPVKVAVVQGTDNARGFLDQMSEEQEPYTFVEVMTCRGGCIGGGGQPKHLGANPDEIRAQRMNGLYAKDAELLLRYSHENPDIIRVYDDELTAPLSALAHRLLHTAYHDRSADLHEDPKRYAKQYQNADENIQKPASEAAKPQYRCTICGYIYEGDITLEPDTYQCPVCFVPKEMFTPVETKAKEESQEEQKKESANLQYRCTICGYIYEGDITLESDTYQCPVCFVSKEMFEKVK